MHGSKYIMSCAYIFDILHPRKSVIIDEKNQSDTQTSIYISVTAVNIVQWEHVR